LHCIDENTAGLMPTGEADILLRTIKQINQVFETGQGQKIRATLVC